MGSTKYIANRQDGKRRLAVYLIAIAYGCLASERAWAENRPLRFAEMAVNISTPKPKPTQGDPQKSEREPAQDATPEQAPELAEIAKGLLKLQCGASQSSAAPYADMFFFRQKAKLPVTPDQEKQLVAAFISQDGPKALALTEALRQDPNGAVRFTANLVALQIWGRAGRALAAKEARALFAALEKDLDSIGAAKADYHYLRALAELESGQPNLALVETEKAIEAEPQFFNAQVVRLGILVDAMEQALRASAEGACLAAYKRLARALNDVSTNSPCALQSAHISLYLRSRQSRPDDHASLLLTELFLSTLSRQRAAFENKAAMLERLPNGESLRCKLSLVTNIPKLRALF